MKMSKWLSATGLALALITGLPGCVSTAAQGQQAGQSAGVTPAPSNDELTVENLLRWPLEGPKGADKVIVGLRQVFDVKPIAGGEFYAKGTVLLADGISLTFTNFNPVSRDIDVGLSESPCYSAADAAAVISAVPSAVTEDAHGEDRGRTYDAQRNGMRVRFTTTPLSYRCVTSIHVHTRRESQP